MPNKNLVQDLRTTEKPFVDLASNLNETQKQEVSSTLASHWNEYGNLLVGQVLFRVVTEIDLALPKAIP
jgi:hypothetical protein